MGAQTLSIIDKKIYNCSKRSFVFTNPDPHFKLSKTATCYTCLPRQIRTCIRPRLHDNVSFDDIHICKYPFCKPFKFENIYQINISFFSYQKETLWWEKKKTYIYIYRLFKIFFQLATFSKISLYIYIYLYINFRSIVLFLDGKIANGQTNNSSNSFIQSRSLSRKFSIYAADQNSKEFG